MSDKKLEKTQPQEIWVDLFEAAEFTGYNYHSMRSIAYKIANQPESEREIKMRKRTSRWELWLPDLFSYIEKRGHGPYGKRSEK